MRAVVLLAFLPGLSLAEVPLTGAEFDALTQGRTLTYARDGRVWGREQYLAGRRVIWAFEGEDCKYGQWEEPVPGLICFAYDDAPEDPECWRFFDRQAGLFAQSELAPEGMLAAIADSDKGLACGGLGV